MEALSNANVLLSCDEIMAALAGVQARLPTETALSSADDDVLEAYVYLGAFEQVLADHVHRGLYNLGNAVSYLQHSRQLIEILTLRLPSRLSRLLDALLRMRILAVVGAAIDQATALRVRARLALREPAAARLWEGLWDLQATLGERLARSAAGETLGDDGAWLARRLGELRRGAWGLPLQLLGTRLRLPSCFNVFDVYPEDCFRLAARVAEGMGDARTPVMCLGIRTSGSYLGPLVAGELRRLGLAEVGYATARPRSLLLGPERRRLAAACRSGHRIVIVDDPPQTGRALAMTAQELRRLGARPKAMTCAYVANSPGHNPKDSADGAEWRNVWAEKIAGVRLVCLEPGERHVSRLLSLEEIGASVGASECRPGSGQPGAEAVMAGADGENAASLATALSRGHQQRRFHLPANDGSGRGAVRAIAAKGVGLGFFGRRAGVIAERLREWVPEVVACRHGVLITNEGPGSAEGDNARPTVAEVAHYVAARAKALSLPVDPSLALDDRAGGWQKLAAELCRSYHMLGPFHAEKVTRRIRQVFAPESPAVIDAAMGKGNWLRTPDGRLRKRGFEEGPFGSNDVLLFDPAYDLASATYELGLSPAQRRELLDEYEHAASQPVGPARLYIHQLLCGSQALNSARIMLAGMRGAAGRRLSKGELRELDATARRAEDFLTRAIHAFLAQVYELRPTKPDGRLVFAVDIDGVLGDGRAGFPSTTPAGAQALRRLARHGFGVVLVTGRSLAQAAAWCEDLGLQGAVAEYGAALWDAREGKSADLRSPEEAADVERVREALTAAEGVHVDPAYRHGIRAYRWLRGSRETLASELVEEAVAASGETKLQAIVGLKQTDLVPQSVDKGRGFRALLDLLGWRPEIIWAVGDTADDLPFLRMAHQAWAPANARSELKRELRRQPGGHVSRASRQLSVLQAATWAACGGARPCRDCRAAVEDVESRTVVDLLAGRNQPVWRAVAGALNSGALAMFRCERQ